MSEHIKDSLHEIETKWSLDDVLDAHLVIEAIEDAKRKAAETTKK